MADKIYTQLPNVHQTSAIKNFFESTVEQLYSKANVVNISGFVGSKSSEDHNVNGAFISEPTVERSYYSLAPTVNTVNLTTGESENFLFYDELISIFNTFGIDTKNHNKFFNSNFQTFLPPVDIDKFVNYQEYFWDPTVQANISSISQANPCIVTTSTSHGFVTGTKVSISDVSGMTEINNSSFFVRVLTDTSVELYTDDDLRLTANSQGYSAFTSGGSIEHKGGPDIITITGSASNPIDIDNDILGKASYTEPNSSTKFVNGQVIKFSGDYVIPQNKTDIEYIVEGVGDSIQLVKKNLNFGNLFNPNLTTKNYYTIGRGAGNENIWSRVNFWYHESLYITNTPVSSARAVRPILEYDKNLEMFNHGTTSRGNVDINAGNLKFENVNGSPEEQSIDGVNLTNGTTIIFPKDNVDIAKHVYNVSISANVINLSVATDPVTSANFTLASNETVTVISGTAHKGKDFYFTSTGLIEAQNKSTANQAPLFNLYNDDLKYLGNESLYPLNNFTGSKIFAHKLGTGTNDAEYGFPISFKPFKSSSEVEYENFIDTVRYSYTAIGSTTETSQNGYYYYKLLKSTPEYHTYLKNASNKNKQRIITKFELSIFDIDESKTKFYIGCIPNVDTDNSSGYDIEVLVNGKKREDFTYSDTGYITFTSFNFAVNDLIDISVLSDSGLLSNDSISKYELPLSWRGNPFNNDVTTIAEPEYLPHFKSYIQDQKNFTGNVLSSNNFANLEKEPSKADQIIQATQDTILGAFLLDNQEHNLVDALRFNNREYTRYKRRFKKELTNYFNVTDVTDLSNEFILEKVLRSLISYSVGKKVFNQTYILPFGDNYTEEKFSISSLDQVSYTLTNYADLDKIENSLLVYLVDSNNNRTLLEVDTDYTITSFNPITVTLSATSGYAIGNTIISKLYNQDRDSAQCPPTPSTMGLYPLYTPTIEVDSSFQTEQSLLVGHDGSKTSLYNDRRDDILLEFEKRIYNSAKAEFRENNSLADLNVAVVKPGAFRNTFYSQNDWNDLLNLNYANWVSSNNLDAVTNEFYDADDSWTWNYRGDSDLPGHWRGWYEYYYDTVRPHTHPWEMLGFTEIPSWWINQYGADYSLSNTSLWHDLEHGIIRRGTRENFTNSLYLESNFNPFIRKGLKNYYPIDDNGALRSPYDITSTQTTTRTVSYTNASANTSAGYVTTSFLETDGSNVNFDAYNVYITSNNISNYATNKIDTSSDLYPIAEKELTYNVVRADLTTGVAANSTVLPSNAIGVLTNGLPLYNPKSSTSYNSENVWHYDIGYQNKSNRAAGIISSTNADSIIVSHVITEDMSNATAWGNSTTHSGIVGWAFDGLPIYGPYGYTDPSNTSSEITNIKSAFVLKSTNRASGPGGKHTGVFVEDYELGSGNVSNGYADKWNHRTGLTPESPNVQIDYYVVTIDDDGEPMFPYAVGGGTEVFESSNLSFASTYFKIAYDVSNNSNNQGYTVPTSEVAISSTKVITKTFTPARNYTWRIGDGASVENAWKYSEEYPFAVTEGLLLARPGLFATLFSDPIKLYNPTANKKQYLSTVTRRKWDFRDTNDFAIHGDINANGEMITNIGYTQFINSWLKFQGLDVNNFADKLRTINLKLGHRLAGYVDKDTMILSLDQYSTTGSSTNLIIPEENITVNVHKSPFKTRNAYSGVIIEKSANGYKIRGYDKTTGYFEYLPGDTRYEKQNVSAGGTPVDYISYTDSTSYEEQVYVEYNDTYYVSKSSVPSSENFNPIYWTSLSALPLENAATGVYYQRDTGVITRAYYETEYTDIQDIFDILAGIGRYQTSLGFDFGEYDADIGDVRNWVYSAKQFLFWTTGSWQIGNTIELSPLASKVMFEAPLGFVAQINKIDRNQFSIMDRQGVAIDPKACDIIRENNVLTVSPPDDNEIYSITLYTAEIEHAMVLDNTTVFADTIYDPFVNQKQNRIKIKATKTANWNGRFLSEGFIIDGDELKPNLDNLAETMGKYHEVGFVPVEKQVYETARSLYGYKERDFLNELDITDDQQFEFYRGMIQNKGTNTSLSRIGRSSSIVQGEMQVYDEWAIKVGDFGDLNNDQTVELKLEKKDVVQDPQLITLSFPEDTTGIIDRIDVLSNTTVYYETPNINIGAPSSGTQALGTVTLNSENKLSSISLTNQGTGYSTAPSVKLEASNTSIILKGNTATSSSAITTINEYGIVDGNITYDYIWPAGVYVDSTTATPSNANSSTQVVSISANSSLRLANVQFTSDNSAIDSIYYNANTSAVSFTEGFFNQYGSSVGVAVVRVDPTISANTTNLSGLGNLIITDNLSGDAATINLNSISSVSDIVTAINSNGNINASVSANEITSTINLNPSANVQYNANTKAYTGEPSNVSIVSTLSISGSDFTLADDDSNTTLGKLLLSNGRYQPRRRYGFIVANNINDTTLSNLDYANIMQVSIEGTAIDSTKYTLDPGDRWSITNTSGKLTSGSIAFDLDTGIVNSSNTFVSENIANIEGIYEFIDVYVDNVKLENNVDVRVFEVPNVSAISFPDVSKLPNNILDTTSEITIVEKATIDLDTTTVTNDIPGNTLRIIAYTEDDLSLKLGLQRSYDITPDASDDEVILIDIDDTDRFLKKPLGVRDYKLWANTSNVTSYGITDSKFNPLPNSGYVNSNNVDFQAFDVPSISNLFDSDVIYKPETSDLIHVAKSENDDWNIYKLSKANATLSFIEQAGGDVTTYLYSKGKSLFDYLDANLIGGNDNGRYLDYHLVLKDTDLVDQFVIWTNEEIVDRKHVSISDFGGVNMLEANISSLGPITSANANSSYNNSIYGISSFTPASSGFTNASAVLIGNNTVQINSQTYNLENGDTVEFYAVDQTDTLYSTSNIQYIHANVTTSVSSSSNVITFPSPPAGVDANNLIYFSTYNNDVVAPIDLHSEEATLYLADANSTLSYVNDSNVVIPSGSLPLLGATANSVTLSTIVNNQIKITVNTTGIEEGDTIRLVASNVEFHDSTWEVSNVNSSSNYIIIESDDWIDLSDNLGIVDKDTIGLTGFNLQDVSNLHANSYTVSNVGLTSFTIEDANISANVDSSNLTFSYFGKTQISTTTDHNISSGEFVKVIGGSYSGYHYAETVSANTFVINVPYNANATANTSISNVITQGIQITTTDDHGISGKYVGKRIAVHMAEPRYYNQVFTVSDVPSSNTIIITQGFSYADVANTQSNGAVLTTLDHNKVRMNNADIVVDNINNERAVVSSFNRALDLRRGFIDDENGEFSMSIPMFTSIDKSFKNNGVDPLMTAGGMPYVTDLKSIAGLTQVGVMPIDPMVELPRGFAKDGFITGQKINPATIGDADYDLNPSRVPYSKINSGPFTPKIIGNSLYDPTGSLQSVNFGQAGNGVEFLTSDNAKPLRVPLYNIDKNAVTKPAGLGTAHIGKPIIDPSKAIVQAKKKTCGPEACITQPVPKKPINVPTTKFERTNYGGTVTASNVSGAGKGARWFRSFYSGYYVNTGKSSGQASKYGGTSSKFGIQPRGLFGAVAWYDNGSRSSVSASLTFSVAGTFYLHAYQAGKGNFSTSYVQINGVQTKGKYVGKGGTYNSTGAVYEFTADAGQTITISAVGKGGGNHWGSIAFHISARKDTLTIEGPYRQVTVGGEPTTSNATTSNNLHGKPDLEFCQQTTRSRGVNDDWFFAPAGSGQVDLIFDNFSGADGYQIFQGTSRGQENTLVYSSLPDKIVKASSGEKQELLAQASNLHKTVNGQTNKFSSQQTIKDFIIAPKNSQGLGVRYGGKLSWYHDSNKGAYIKVRVLKQSSVYRFLIKLPKVAPPIDNPNPGTGCTQVTVYQPGVATPTGGSQSPIYQPTGNPQTTKKGGGGGGYISVGGVGGGSGRSRGSLNHKYAYQMNFGGFGTPAMAGYSYVPTVFKKTIKVASTPNFGSLQQLDDSIYVNSTSQRVTGGITLPLAKPLSRKAQVGPKALRSVDLSTFPIFDELIGNNSGNFYRNNNTVSYRPRKIGSTIKLSDGTIISNVLNTVDLQDVIGGDNIVISFPSSGVNVFRPVSRNTVDMQPPITVPSDDAPINDVIDFADTPEIAITPLLRDEFGALLPAGDTAVAVLNSPTPGYTMSIPDMIGIEPGSELLINGSSIVFPGSDPAIIENALKCSDNNGFTVTPTTKDKTNAVRISSCSGAPLTIRDGCAGGVYKEVLDFHVVRGFEQTISDTSNTVTLPTSTGYQTGNTSSVAPEAVYTLYDVEGTATQQIGGSGVIDTETGAVLSSRTTTTTTGGSGYSVGDRLRVVGGVPVADPYGPITEICIDNPGSGYTSEANVKVYIGNGVTPGTGALAGSVILNETGGLHKVLLLSGGSGYDMSRPPEVRIVDLGQGTSIVPATPAKAHAKVGSGASLPPRVSKFVVTSIDPNGTITSLQVIDRGIYKQFPSDLTQGVPLEYDIIGLGDETGYDDAGNYFQGTGLGQYDPTNNNASLDSPGGYDPLRGTTGGGKGARVFLTAREIPDCSERGDAKSRLGLPDIVADISIPDDMAANLNDALRRAGYDPDDIYFDTDVINDDITNLVLRSPGYDGVDIDEFTPGFLDKLGIPKGTYDPDMLCMVATLSTSTTEPTRQTRTNNNTLANDQGYSTLMPIDVPRIQITCVDTLGWNLYDNGFGNGIDNNSLFGDGNVSFTTDMYQYELRKLDGTPVNIASGQQECSVHYLESMRFANISQLNSFNRPDGNLTLSDYSNVWIDSDSNTEGKTNFITNGWSYYENGIANKWQTPMVDTEFVKNVILYDKESGTKEVDFHFWDPFKGVIPGFLDREITYKSNQDPVVYNSARSVFGEKHIGQVWWDTSTIAYQWYEQGLDEFGNPNNRERWLNWGKAFPGSAVTLYEWVESKELPLNYSGTGTPRNGSDYITRKVLNEKVGTYQNYYYFWVQNKEDLSNEIKTSLGRNWNTLTLAKYIADPVRYGLPMVSFVSDQSFVLTNLSQNIREDEQILQINLSRNLNPIGEKHTAWKLMRESDNNSIVPDDLGNKLIDSLTGENAIGQSVPDPLLSEVEAYGIKFRPRQSMFKNVKNARRVLFYTLNEILAETKLQTNYPNWDADLPNAKTYIETTNWFAIQRINNSDNSKIRYDNTFKPIFSVGSVQELDSLNNLPDDTIVQVQAKESDRYQLWEYTGSSNSFELIAIENDTIKLKDTVYTDDTNATLSLELRKLLVALRDTVFAGTNLWNKLFFALLRYSYIEQEQLDWAFKSTYIYIEKDEEDLIEVNGFKIDNFDKVLQYFDEVKPYTAKVRQYKDGKSPPKEFISGNSVSDFDKPPYADPITGNIRILNDSVADDVKILSTNNTYLKYYSISDKSQDPIRRFKSTIKFDRTSYELYPMDFQAGVGNVVDLSLTTSNNNVIENTTSSTATIERGNVAIARNIVNLMGMSNAELHANVYTRAIDRIFKLDTTVISSFTTQLNEHFDVTDAYSNANIINSTANITAVIDAGNLTTTFDILKTKAGGDFQGEVIDANVFTKYAEGIPDSEVAQVFGFSSQPLDSIKFDEGIAIDNYEGVFTGTSTLVRDSLPYDGFDGVTFQRVLYGEERPQELALLGPLESLLITVTTNANLQGNANLSSASSNASTVKYQVHSNIFGDTEYLRLLEDGSTSSLLTANLTVTDGTISVANASVFTPPKSGVPGVVWVGDERIEFTRYHNGDASSNVLTGITRGTKGTAIQNWYASDNVRVFNGSQKENFTDAVLNVPNSTYNVDSNIWLDSGSTSLADKGNASSNANSIMKFLHNL